METALPQRQYFLKNLILWALSACLIVLGTFTSVASLVALLACAVALFFLKSEAAVALLIFVMPFATVFKITPTGQSFFTYLLLFFVLVSILKHKSIQVKFVVMFLLLLFCLLVASIERIHLLRLIKFCANLWFVYYALQIDTENSRKMIFLAYILGVLCSSAVAWLDIIPNELAYVEEIILGDTGGEIVRFTGLYGDPNYYSISLILSLCLLILLFYKREIHGLFALGLSIPLVLFSVLTYSKSAFLMLALPLVLLFYANSKGKRHFLQLLLLGIVVLGVGAVLVGRLDLFSTVLERFAQDSTVSDLTTGRTDLWKMYWDYCCEHIGRLIIGNGFGAALVNGAGAHNTYLDILYYLGISGGLCFGGVCVVLSRLVPRPRKRNLLNYSVWLCLGVMYFFLSQLFYFDIAVQLYLAILVMNTSLEKQVKETDGGKNEAVVA